MTKWLFLISIFILFPLGEVTRYQFANGFALSLFDCAAVLNLLILFVIAVKKKNIFSFHLSKPIGIFLIFCFISLLANLSVLPLFSIGVASLYIVRFLAYASFYPTVGLLSGKIKENAPGFLIIAGVLVGVFGIAQFFLYPTLQNLYYLGWDRHWYRLFATFFDPNFAGIVLVFPLFFSLFYTYQSFVKRNISRMLFYFSTTAFLLISLFLTFSRSALLALIGGLIVFILKSKVPGWVSIGIFGFIIAGVVLISINYKATEGTKLYRVASSQARVDSVQAALTIFEKNPVFGIGFNAYRYAQYRYGFATGPNWETSHSGAGTDNSLLFVLATTGIVGFGAFFYLCFSIFKFMRKNTNSISIPIAASFFALLIGSFFINAFFYPAVMFLFWSCLGLIENTKR